MEKEVRTDRREIALTDLKGIGDKTAKLFHKINIKNAEELLHYYPNDYDSFKEPVTAEHMIPGEICAVRGCLAGSITVKRVRNLTITNFMLQDVCGRISMTYFNMPYIKNIVKSGFFYIFRGVPQKKNGNLIMEQAQIYKPEDYFKLTSVLQPRYALTAGLSSRMVAKAVRQVLPAVGPEEDFLPSDIKENQKLTAYSRALEDIHFPESYEAMIEARRRLAFDEFFLFILGIRKCKEQNEILSNIFPMPNETETDRLIRQLPYRLTNAQQKVWKEIKVDLQGTKVMNRLIQGDVGSGKTILAFLALLICTANGCQGAMMAPTEVLARQHYEALKEMTVQYGLALHPVLLTGSMTAKEKKAVCEEIASGSAAVVIGTHALIQEKVSYAKLALVITDEQHRFGVRQREMLAGKGENVHVMIMSATPIPRTLAIILYGDLDISIVDELPADRLPIKNCVVSTDYREKAYRFMEKEVSSGRQVYVICPMIEEGELAGAENVISYTEKLKARLSQNIQIASLHGKMRPADKIRIMEEYEAHHIDILVSTTVIEVGINVPNASMMLIENAERFGLAQLHQLRGRIGRGIHQSYCIFISSSDKKETMERLAILNHSNDGFYIAGEDLKLRGPGDLFGIRQSGILDFKIGDVFQDADLLQLAGECVSRILEEDEGLTAPEHIALREHLNQIWNAVDFTII